MPLPLDLCTKIKETLDSLKKKRDEFESILTEAQDTKDFTEARSLKTEIETGMKDLEKLLGPEYAREIMGKENVLGPEEVEKAFGIRAENVPPIPPSIIEWLSEADPEVIKGKQLVFYADKTNEGKPLTPLELKKIFPDNKTSTNTTLFNNDWYDTNHGTKDEHPRLGWRLTDKEPLATSASKNYLEQTEELVKHLREEVFKNTEMPEEYQEAIEEFEAEKESLRPLVISSNESEWKPAAEKLAKLNEKFRENYIEVLYRLALHEKTTGQRLLDSQDRSIYYTWTTSRSAGGGLVLVGGFGAGGASVGGWGPGNARPFIGVSLSRSG